MTKDLGVDISWWQGAVDYAKMKSKGIQFVIARAGSINANTGAAYDDYAFATHSQELPKHWDPSDIGYYWFFRGKWDPILQADYMVDLIESEEWGIPPICDTEANDHPDLMDRVQAFCQRIEQRIDIESRIAPKWRGKIPPKVGIYTNLYFIRSVFKRDPRLAQQWLWQAQWNGGADPTIEPPFTASQVLFHQFMVTRGNGPEYGVESKDLDLDYRLVQPNVLPPTQPPQDLEQQVAQNTDSIVALQHQVAAAEEHLEYLQGRVDRIYTAAEELGHE